ncbi:MAG: 30S ribosomal protein S6 [Candidatus Cloacimonetes bacterium]|nr:30S ribosomal protein S6 [Candidatus Cloacimonadota bacterium]
MAKKYESMVVVSPNMTEAAAKKELDKTIDFIKNNEGEVIKFDELGKKRLAYEIKHLKEGYYFLINFTLDESKTREFETVYRLNETIIRHNLLTK